MQFNLGEFGDGNPYTVVSEDLKTVLTSAPSGAWSGFLLQGSGLSPITDPVLGTKFVDVNGDEAGYRFNSMLSALSQTHYEGHVKIKASREWVCAPEASSNGNQGDTLASAQKLISALATSAPAGTATALINRDTTSSINALMPAASNQTFVRNDYRNFVHTNTAAQAVYHTAGKPDQVEMDIFWKGAYGFVAVDGCVTNACNDRQSAGWVNIWNNFYLGSDRGIAGTFCKDHWFKDFEIRTKCPEFVCNYQNRNISVLSDSLFDSESIAAATAGDVSAQFRMQRKLNKRGQYCNINISENGGYRIYNTGANWLGDTAPIAATLSTNPSIVYVCGGTNDAIYSGPEITPAQFQAAYIDILEKLLGENGNDSTNVHTVRCITPIPLWGARDAADYEENVRRAAGFREVILGLPALWAATYPLSTATIEVINAFNGLGGESNKFGDDLYKGDLLGTRTDLHLGGHGMQIFGDLIASTL